VSSVSSAEPTRPPGPHGVLVVDKPAGMTSHDVVRVVRRALRTRRVGHAGTLDPMATGVLVIGVGEGTKLLHHLAADDKAYLATVTLGTETDSLDAEGQIVAQAPVPEGLSLEHVREVASKFVGPQRQVAPKVSAIKQQGVPLHERVRRGEEVVAPERDVIVHTLDVLEVRDGCISLRVHCGKGFYVRSLARDLARALGTLGHLSALRRTHSGLFDLADATPLGEEPAATFPPRLLTLAAAMRGVPIVTVTDKGFVDVRCGRALVGDALMDPQLPPDDTEPVAVLDGAGALVGIGRAREGRVEIVRGVFG
jgi:tRNA pseudouridine55 synthase